MFTDPWQIWQQLPLTHIQIDACVAAVRVGVQSGHAVRRQQIGQPDAQAGKEAEQALQEENASTRDHSEVGDDHLPAPLCRDCASRGPVVYRAQHVVDPPACRVWSA